MPIVLAIGIVVFAPGLPFYIMFKDSFPYSHIHYNDFTHYDVQFSQETYSAEHEGVIASVPAHFSHKDDLSFTRFFYICVSEEEDNIERLVISRFGQGIEENFDIEKHAGVPKKGAKKWFKSVGRDVPQSMFETVYIWHSLTWDDFRFTTSNRSFYALATIKESLEHYLKNGEYYYYENAYIKGFIFISQINDETVSFMGDFFFTSNENDGLLVSMTVRDKETAWAFINSIRVGS
jgi:hypothetical protein